MTNPAAPLDHRAAVLERRADRARELTHAAEVILLGYDDSEDSIRVVWQPGQFAGLPGVRNAPAAREGTE